LPELFVVGDFPNPFGPTAEGRKLKTKAIEAGSWEPDGDDLALVAKQSGGPDHALSPKDLFSLLRVIADSTHKGSLSRLHVITHGNPGDVALAGRINLPKGGVGAATIDLFDKGFNEPTLDKACRSFVPGKKAKIFISTIRERFADDGRIVIYACHSGSARAGPASPPSNVLLGQIAALLGVAVTGFNGLIAFCPNPVRNEILVGIGDCKDTARSVRDIRQLATMSGGSVVTVPKPSGEKLWECSQEEESTSKPKKPKR
jgi:hypothetical protein